MNPCNECIVKAMCDSEYGCDLFKDYIVHFLGRYRFFESFEYKYVKSTINISNKDKGITFSVQCNLKEEAIPFIQGDVTINIKNGEVINADLRI